MLDFTRSADLRLFAVDSKIIGISDEFVAPFFQLLVQFVQDDIGKQR